MMLRSTQIAGAVRWNRSRRKLLSSVAAVLESRAVIEISGVDAKALLQGLVTNDVSLLDDGEGGRPCIPAAFLNPKGRVLGDALVTRSPRQAAKRKPGYLLDCPQSVAEGLKTHLKLYKLRSKVKIKDATATYDVLVSGVQDPWHTAAESRGGGDQSAAPKNAAGEADAGAVGRVARFADPRCAALGVRVIRPKGSSDVSWPDGDTLVPENRYDALRIFNGVGEGSELVDSIPLESNLDLLGAISFTKGCYVGQELTARTQFKGFVRKRILPVLFPANGAHASASPIRGSSRVAADAGDGQGPLLLQAWGAGKGEVAPSPPEAGSKIVDRAAEDGKVGTLVKASPEYNVGLALFRLGKIMSTSGPGGSANPAVDCCVLDGAGQGEAELLRRCLPLTPPWWPVGLNPATGKVPA